MQGIILPNIDTVRVAPCATALFCNRAPWSMLLTQDKHHSEVV